MSITDELLPCPKCGSTDLKLYTTDSRRSMRKGHVRCNRCRIKVEADSNVMGYMRDYPQFETYEELRDFAVSEAKRNAIAEWNRRVDG